MLDVIVFYQITYKIRVILSTLMEVNLIKNFIFIAELKLEKTNSKSADKMSNYVDNNQLVISDSIYDMNSCKKLNRIQPVKNEKFPLDPLQSIQDNSKNVILENFNLITLKDNRDNNFEELLFDEIKMKNKFYEIKTIEKKYKALDCVDQESEETSDLSDCDFSSFTTLNNESDSSSDLELNVVNDCEIIPVDYVIKSYISKKAILDDKMKKMKIEKIEISKILRKFNNVKEVCNRNKLSIDLSMVINYSKLFKK